MRIHSPAAEGAVYDLESCLGQVQLSRPLQNHLKLMPEILLQRGLPTMTTQKDIEFVGGGGLTPP